MNIGVSVVGNSTSTWQINYTVDDPSGAYPNPTLAHRTRQSCAHRRDTGQNERSGRAIANFW
jgi:hypothetical protein